MRSFGLVQHSFELCSLCWRRHNCNCHEALCRQPRLGWKPSTDSTSWMRAVPGRALQLWPLQSQGKKGVGQEKERRLLWVMASRENQEKTTMIRTAGLPSWTVSFAAHHLSTPFSCRSQSFKIFTSYIIRTPRLPQTAKPTHSLAMFCLLLS